MAHQTERKYSASLGNDTREVTSLQQIYLVDINGKSTPKELTSGKQGATHEPVFNTAGDKVAWTELDQDGHESDRYDRLQPRWMYALNFKQGEAGALRSQKRGPVHYHPGLGSLRRLDRRMYAYMRLLNLVADHSAVCARRQDYLHHCRRHRACQDLLLARPRHAVSQHNRPEAPRNLQQPTRDHVERCSFRRPASFKRPPRFYSLIDDVAE